MKKLIIISTIMLVVAGILGGCTPKEVEAKTEFAVTIINNTDLVFDEVNYDYSIDGNAIGGGKVNPEKGDNFVKNEEIYVDFIPDYFPEEDADLSKFSMNFYIMQDDKKLDIAIDINAKYGEYYKFYLNNTTDGKLTLEQVD